MDSHTKQLVQLALAEDLGDAGDITSNATIAAEQMAKGVFIAREDLYICGHDVVAEVFSQLDPEVEYRALKEIGTLVKSGEIIAEASGRVRSLLSAERTALNFLQRLSGISTLTARLSHQVSASGVKLLDTRKTTPGWRGLEKAAVLAGGGHNHRSGLFDAVLIKNNHVDAIGGDIAAAIRACKEKTAAGTKIEVEVRDQAELQAALAENPDAILLDNMTPVQLGEAVEFVRADPNGRNIQLEASGGINVENLQDYAATGVDCISLGMLTHSAPAVDISFRYKEDGY